VLSVPLSLTHITGQTPMGRNLLPSGLGVTFRVWAPAAREVQVLMGLHNALPQLIPDAANHFVCKFRGCRPSL